MKQTVCVYKYFDENGKLIAFKERFKDKSFRWKLPNGSIGLNGLEPPLYNLYALTARVDEPVFAVEGEKDADNLMKAGLLAVSPPHGAGSWNPKYNYRFQGREVYIIPDNDKAGLEHAEAVAASLSGVAKSVKIIRLSGLPDKGDVSDWLAQQHELPEANGRNLVCEKHICPVCSSAAEKLLAMAEEAPEWEPPQDFEPITPEDELAALFDKGFEPEDTTTATPKASATTAVGVKSGAVATPLSPNQLAEKIREALRCGRPNCSCMRGKLVHCPAHNDEHPSLSVEVKGGMLLVKCHANCSQEAVIEELRRQGLWFEGRPKTGLVRRPAKELPKPAEAKAEAKVVNEELEPDNELVHDRGSYALAEELYAAGFHEEYRWLVEKQSWVHWNGKYWELEKEQAVVLVAARGVLQRRLAKRLEGASPQEVKRVQELLGWLNDEHRPENALKYLRGKKGVCLSQADCDKDLELINCQNGVLDLRTGELKPHEPKYLMTRIANAEYIPNAKHELVDRLIEHVSGGNPEYEAYLQKAVGYSLTGLTIEEVAFLLLGPKHTGKTTFLEAVHAMLGTYAKTIGWDAICATSKYQTAQDAPKPTLADLPGVRFVSASETSEGKTLDAAIFKRITGGDTIAVRPLYGKPFEYVPAFKLWLATNMPPNIDDTDDALWRRIIRLPFENMLEEDKIDKRFKNKLKTNRNCVNALFAWAVAGCLRWREEGLKPPQLVKDRTTELRASFNPLLEFFEECCEFGLEYSIPAGELREAYKAWANDAGAKPISDKEWSYRLEAYGCKKLQQRIDGRKTKVWRGIRLKSD